MLVHEIFLIDWLEVSLINKLVIISITSILTLTAFWNNKNNSHFSYINLILLPYVISVGAISLVSLLENETIVWLEQVNLLNSFKIFDPSGTKSVNLYLLGSIIFIPCLPYLANQLIKRLSEPKEI